MLTGALFDIAQTAMSAIEDAFNAANSGAGVAMPERRYIATGEVAYDCSLLVVAFRRLHTGPPGVEEALSQREPLFVLTAAYSVHIQRCVPTLNDAGEPPTDTALQASTEALLTDVELIVSGLLRAWSTKAFGDCEQMAILGADAIGPEGAEGGFRVDFEVSLP